MDLGNPITEFYDGRDTSNYILCQFNRLYYYIILTPVARGLRKSERYRFLSSLVSPRIDFDDESLVRIGT